MNDIKLKRRADDMQESLVISEHDQAEYFRILCLEIQNIQDKGEPIPLVFISIFLAHQDIFIACSNAGIQYLDELVGALDTDPKTVSEIFEGKEGEELLENIIGFYFIEDDDVQRIEH